MIEVIKLYLKNNSNNFEIIIFKLFANEFYFVRNKALNFVGLY
jgi:hypothetical protein